MYGDCGSKGIAKRWHGRMKLAPEMLNGGLNSGEVIGRGQTRIHCRPYAIYKDGAELQGTNLAAAMAAEAKEAHEVQCAWTWTLKSNQGNWTWT
jgi:hypothetical protein